MLSPPPIVTSVAEYPSAFISVGVCIATAGCRGCIHRHLSCLASSSRHSPFIVTSPPPLRRATVASPTPLASPSPSPSQSPSLRLSHPPAMMFDSFILRTSPRWITLEPSTPAVSNHTLLFIDRDTLDCRMRSRADCAALREPESESLVYGLVGLVDTLHDSHLLLITARDQAGTVMERPVWRVRTLSALPVRGRKKLKSLVGSLSLSKRDLAEEDSVVAMLQTAVSLPTFYYSHALDLTRSAQKRADATATGLSDASAAPDFLRADMRFVWNRFAAQRLINVGAVSWLVPLILGYVDVRVGLVNGKSVELALISRRAADRPGLRFTARGADVNGHVSNFVETEQIVSHGDAFASFVQVRGSIPLLWEQRACIRYKPTPTLRDVDDGGKSGLCQQAFEKHFERLFEQYGPVTAISLVEQVKTEGMLHQAYNDAVDAMASAKLHFVAWDFHKNTKGMKYEKVEQDLVPAIDADLGAYSYFYAKDGTSASITRRQRGVIRTNCIDSLDRTNVVQSAIAHRIMDAALKAMGVLDSNPETCSTRKFAAFEKEVKNTWADHADALSKFYSGSGALKTDYTRTGKRSKGGMVVDGVRALRRYVYQNVLDGRRQDGIDVLLGVVRMPDVGKPRSLDAIASRAEPLVVKEKFLPHLALICLCVAIAGMLVPRPFMTRMMVTGVGLLGMVLFSQLALKAGHKLVARPKLDGTH